MMDRITLAEIRARRDRGEALPPEIEAALHEAGRQLDAALRSFKQRFVAAIDAEFGEGTAGLLENPWAAFDGDSAAINVLAPGLSWKPQSPAAEAEYGRQAKDVGGERKMYERHALTGCYMAAQEMNTPQKIRRTKGGKYLKGDDGKPALIAPSDLLPEHAVHVFAMRAKSAAEASLLGTEWPPQRRDVLDLGLDKTKQPRVVGAGALDAKASMLPEWAAVVRADPRWTEGWWKDEEGSRDETDEIEEVKRRGPPQYRRDLDVLQVFLHENHPASYAEAVAHLATTRGVTKGLIYVQNSKARKRRRQPPD